MHMAETQEVSLILIDLPARCLPAHELKLYLYLKWFEEGVLRYYQIMHTGSASRLYAANDAQFPWHG